MNDYQVQDRPTPDMSEAAFLAALRSQGSPVPEAAARGVYAYCVEERFSPAALLAWFRHESGCGRNGWAARTFSWGNTRPPSFMWAHRGVYDQDSGAFYPANITPPAGHRYLSAYDNWEAGGISTVARFCYHVPYRGKLTVREIVPVWAPSDDGNDVEAYIAAVLADIARWATPQGGSMAPKIALAAGHHNSSGGDEYEKAQTGPLCAAVAAHCRALGMDVRVVQPDQGRGMILGSLDVVGQTVVKWAGEGWEPDIFLECHTEGGGGVGVFAIYPDADGDLDVDVKDRLGPDVARRVAAATGLAVGGRSNGTMSERQTGVGGQGFRLGIFRTTAPLKEGTTRLIIEYGAHDKQPDKGIAERAGFADACGKATAEAFAAFLGWSGAGAVGNQTTPTPAPSPGGVRVEVPGTGEAYWLVEPILTYYRAHGDLAAFGWPLTGLYTETEGEAKGLAVQYFERARLEVQADGTVTEGRLGSELLALRRKAA